MVVADLIGEPLEYHADIFERIEQRFTSRGLRTPAINRRQAMVPRGAAVLPNKNGTAPGLWIEHDRKLILLLPGPPRELKPMLEAVIQERLLGLVGVSRLFRAVLRITGQSESSVEEKMQPLYAKWLASPDQDRDDDSRVAGADRTAPHSGGHERGRGTARARRCGD
jgi:nicotinamide-nucleotide amidase